MKRNTLILLAVMLSIPAQAQNSVIDFGKTILENGSSHSSGDSSLGAGLSDSQIASGLKDALQVGTKNAVATVGHPGGFLNDPKVRIPLPGPLEKMRSGMAMVGASGLADDLDRRINMAAEQAAPKATRIFGDAVTRMSIKDARGILTGPNDSATQYFKEKTTPQLTLAMKPLIDEALAKVGAVQSYNALTEQVKSVPMTSGVDLDLSDYVVVKALNGIFYYLAQQEADIRSNPAARTTDALRTIFK